ncbi:MAG: Lrp/AsnC family transcriptional regulator [Acidimicrobiales bacterium]
MAPRGAIAESSSTGARTGAGIDAIDRRILEVLSRDGRASIRDVAGQVCIGRATAHSRVRRLQDQGVIKRFTVVVDPRRVGAGLAAFVHIKIDQHAWKVLRGLVAALPGVEHVALVSGDFDLVVLVRLHDPSDLRDVVLERLHAIEGVTATRTTFILDEVEGAGLFRGSGREVQ